MRTSDPVRRGWCPGALRPMPTGDGLLVRVRPRAGRYTTAQLEAIARAASAFGNGEIDLTNRANLQIRGVSQETLPDLTARLAAADLIDASAAAEAVRNVLVAPLSGLDPSSRDVRPLAEALEAAAAGDSLFHELPGKFGFAVDGGGRFELRPGTADIMLRAEPRGQIAVTLDGDDTVCARVSEREAVAAVRRSIEVFLEFARRDAGVRRMRSAVERHGVVRSIRQAGLIPERTAAADPHGASPLPTPVGCIGPPDRPWAVGIGLPYGRMTGKQLAAVTALAAGRGPLEARPSPGRLLVFPIRTAADMSVLLALGRDLELIVSDDDPRLAMDVCPGAPACVHGSTATRRDADDIASVLRRMNAPLPSLHVSGCIKGCARRGGADLALVARNGVYDIVVKGDIGAAPVVSEIPSARLAATVERILRSRDA